MRKTFILVDEMCFRTYVMDALGSVDEYYIGQVLDYGYVEVVRVQTERYKACKEME